MNEPATTPDLLDSALRGMAFGRLGIGASSRVAARASTVIGGLGGGASGELDYMMRVFGIRAVALGTGYLTSAGDAQRAWQRLAFMCDVSDTIAGLNHMRRRDIPLASAIGLTLLTGSYALIGAAKIRRDLESGG